VSGPGNGDTSLIISINRKCPRQRVREARGSRGMLRAYILSLMKDRRNSPADKLVKGALLLLSWVYGSAVRLIDLAYRSGIRKVTAVPAPVVSVGNLTLGGTGKTPFAVFLADHFLAGGKRPAILTRGYGGDENRMLKDEIAGVPVLAGQDRVKNALKAASSGSDVLILDDGFQHRRIARDLDILMIDGVRPFGNGRLFPRGTLREPASALERADILVVTKCDMISEAEKDRITGRLRGALPGKPLVLARHRPTFFSDATGAAYPPEHLSGRKVCLVSGIADADYLAYIVEKLGAGIAARIDFGDHHRYSPRDIAEVRRVCGRSGAEAVITTRKDQVKLRELDIPDLEGRLYVLNVVIDIIEGKEKLVAGLNSVVNG